MRSSSVITPFSLLALHLQSTVAFWRMSCSVAQTARIDPILSYGTVSSHVHKFAGGINVNQYSTQDSLLDSSCSTCEVQKDLSAYWTPLLYYEHANGTIEEVQNDGMTVYYVGRGGTSSNTVPFPEGFKMVSGDTFLRHYDTQNLTYLDTRPIADRVSFRCINEANNIPETHYINDTNCVNGLRAQINFQSCWDGVNLYLPGSAHVAYLSGIDYGVCPPSHPVPIPGLFFEVLYWSNRINQSDGGRFVFANGDASGFGFHGDFLNGWDQEIQTEAVKQCLYVDDGGLPEACSVLTPSVNKNFARICPEAPSVLSEVVTGVLPGDQLPGCNPITGEGPDARPIICSSGSVSVIGVSTSLPITKASMTPTILVTTVTTLSASSSLSTVTSSVSLLTASSFASTTTITGTATVLNTTSQAAGGIFVAASISSTSTSSQAMTATVTDTITITITDLPVTMSQVLTSSCVSLSGSNSTYCRTMSLINSTTVNLPTIYINLQRTATTIPINLKQTASTMTRVTEAQMMKVRRQEEVTTILEPSTITVTETTTITAIEFMTSQNLTSTSSCLTMTDNSTYCDVGSMTASAMTDSPALTESNANTVMVTATDSSSIETETTTVTPAEHFKRGALVTYRIRGRPVVGVRWRSS